ncbi:histidine phosphatase family protein [Spiribacter salinus]|jgi:broad specificity phosphatase PhoE|uniref:histidine phosphatase family protein n=1 Tax=Spiribacter salinus TaxID=1335746 RepID=UPI001C96F388|nr:histidine phosphatase family protein [Spiribacter salinus]MBY5268307.1 histidine phosphatase family protein [Spiribacter salinus]
MKRVSIILGLILITASALAQNDPVTALRDDGHVLMLRHAIAPGFGDPAEFDINDCTTQRNLSEEGRAQAKSIGERLRGAGLSDVAVYTSAWCRCRETAAEMDLTEAEPHPGLNSFFQDRERRDEIVAELRDLLAELADGPPAVLVTHQVNIRAITGQGVRSGEGLIVKPDDEGSVRVIASIDGG